MKPRELPRVLKSLEVDEGIRVDGADAGLRMFVSKSHSGLFAIELVDKLARNRVSNESNIQYLNSVNDVLLHIRSNFKKEPSYYVY
ncbi:MAG: hypothetical protein M3P20_00830 [Thermoproteota archaeon]|nr:hypothetical protein [Thermoproteota archaeon]MDQ3976327.1 hypothetical protein [Thermoproteota archaeon]